MSPLIKSRPIQSPITQSIIFFSVGLVGLCVAGYLLWRDHQIMSNSTKVTGTVVRLRHTKGGNKPEISWVVGENTYKMVTGAFSSASEAKIGDNVELVVSNQDPSDALIDSPSDRFSLSGIIGGMGLVMLLGGISILKRKPDPIDGDYKGKPIRTVLFLQGKYGDFIKARKARDLGKIKSLLSSIGIDESRLTTILAEYEQKFNSPS